MSAVSLNREMSAALVDELAIVVGAMIDASPSVATGAPAMGHQWVAEIHASGALEGAVTLVLDHDGCVGITRQMTGVEGELPSEAVLDALREVLAQAVGSLSLKPVARGAKLTVASLTEKDDLVPEGEWSAHAIEADKLSTALSVTVWGSLSSPQPAAAVAAVAAGAAASASNDDRIEVLLDIDLPLVVRFGQTELPLRQLTRLGPGSVIDLGRSPDDPVDVLVSNRVVARGEVVVVGGSYGIRILDVVSQRERVRSMEG
jgi:flagellar motor switch protein FliN